MAGYRGRVKMAFICKKCLPNRLTYGKIANVAKISRHVGMADEADSKSVDGDIVWVQVPLPALPWQGEVLRLMISSFLGLFLLLTQPIESFVEKASYLLYYVRSI